MVKGPMYAKYVVGNAHILKCYPPVCFFKPNRWQYLFIYLFMVIFKIGCDHIYIYIPNIKITIFKCRV